jgi:hypothetical protein
MNNLITVDPREIQFYAEEGGKLMFKASAEEHLIKLLELQKRIDEAVDSVKEKITDAGKEIDPDFKGVVGPKVSAVYRYFGGKYDYDRSVTGDALPYLKEITYYKPNPEAIDKYIGEVGEMPPGIKEKDRNKQLTLTIKDD